VTDNDGLVDTCHHPILAYIFGIWMRKVEKATGLMQGARRPNLAELSLGAEVRRVSGFFHGANNVVKVPF
jgi:hypothetical protein